MQPTVGALPHQLGHALPPVPARRRLDHKTRLFCPALLRNSSSLTGVSQDTHHAQTLHTGRFDGHLSSALACSTLQPTGQMSCQRPILGKACPSTLQQAAAPHVLVTRRGRVLVCAGAAASAAPAAPVAAVVPTITSSKPAGSRSRASPAAGLALQFATDLAASSTSPQPLALDTSSLQHNTRQTQHTAQGKTLGASNSPHIPVMRVVGGQRVHSMSQHGHDVVRSMSDWAGAELPRYLRSSDHCWQPADLLPNAASDTFMDEVADLRMSAQQLPPDLLVALVGDMVTEEALPSYMSMLNTLDGGVRDETGASTSPWACWTRAWTAEENRHGDALNTYLYLSGRVDMLAVETTIQHLIGSGLDPQLENNPYLCFVYTSFQERATKISHAATARLAASHGEARLARLCMAIAGDEARHEAAYTAIVSELIRRDPQNAVLAFASMMKKGIVMPAHMLDDGGWHAAHNRGGGGSGPRASLFVDYATVADQLGVYTTQDYADIVEHLVAKWGIASLRLSGEAAGAQDYLCSHAGRIRRLADLQVERRLRDRKRGRMRSAAFSWIHKRELSLN